MSPDSTPSLRDSAKFRILRNLNTADVYDNLRRGPKHWSNVASELLLAFLDSRLATNAHLRFLDQLQDGRPARPNIAHMDTFTLRNSEIGFAGKAKKIDFGTKQLVPYSPITPNAIADNDTREVNQRIFQNHPTINPSLPRIHVLGPTSRDQEYNNGVLYRGEGDEVLGAITDFKGGIEIHRTDGVSVLSPEEINTRGLREDATAVFGVSQFIQTRRRDLNVTDAELFEHAIAISEANGYMISYNTRFGYLGDTGDALSYYVVRTNPFLINDLYHSF
ncbi:hypothetical protein KC909_06125, partial [Candidatus Dojkabacteria bacterium]|nr:hypothetical protein [Candidatus Dojkabacteria bacterium]